MKVQVHNSLSCVLAAVVDYAVAVFKTKLFCYLRNDREDMSHSICVVLCYLVYTADVLLRDKQNVYRSLWV